MVDLVLTDPPYGLGTKMSVGGTWAENPIYRDMTEWDLSPVDGELLLSAVAKGKNAIIWGGNYFSLPPSRCWLVWDKREKMSTMADAEFAWTNIDRVAKSFTERRNPDGKRYHPTQNPLSLMQWCIGFPNCKVDTIFDPFMGSGTTLCAAKNF